MPFQEYRAKEYGQPKGRGGGNGNKDYPVIEISRIKILKMNGTLFVSQRCRAPFWKCTRDVKGGGGTSLIPDICTEECLVHLRVPQISPMHLPQEGSSYKANDQMSVCQHSDISYARVRRNYSLRKLHGSTQPL